jgi:hypothetical protein
LKKPNIHKALVEGVDRPAPLIHLINGGENACKTMTARG